MTDTHLGMETTNEMCQVALYYIVKDDSAPKPLKN